MIVTFYAGEVWQAIETENIGYCSIEPIMVSDANSNKATYRAFSIYNIHGQVIFDMCGLYAKITESIDGADPYGGLFEVSEQLFHAFLGNSDKGIKEGWIARSKGVDGFDIDVIKLVNMIRTKAEGNKSV